MIYASQAVRAFGAEELVDLLTAARARNESAGVTGMLLYSGYSFLQVLEGDAAAVEQIYDLIRTDPRHASFRVLLDAGRPDRLFPDWTMGFEHLDEQALAARVPGYTPSDRYPLMNPEYIVDGSVAETLFGLYAGHRV